MLRLTGPGLRRTSMAAAAIAIAVAAGTWMKASLDDASEPIRILVSPELTDLRPILDDFARAEGIRVEMRSADGTPITRQLAAAPSVDAVFLPAAPELDGTGDRKLGAGRAILSSPVLLALKASAAERLGWTSGQSTWKEIASAARGHRFTFGMAAPDTSYSGRATVLAAATGLTGTIDSLSDSAIYPAAGGLRGISAAQTVTAPTDPALVTDYLRTRGDSADGLFTYEAQIARLNASGRLRERLVPIRPSDGVVSAKYTLRPLLKPRTPEAAERVSRLTDHLVSADVQRALAERSHARPVIPGVSLPTDLRGTPPRLLSVPRDQTVADRLVAVYLGRYRYATRTVFLLDVSGSMKGARIADLRRAASVLARPPVTESSGITADEQAIFLPFASVPAKPTIIDLPSARPAEGRKSVQKVLAALDPGGETAAYDALVAALRELARLGTDDRTTSIVLITDGMSNRGWKMSDYLKYHDTLPKNLKRVPIYPVLVDDADKPSMRKLAEHTGGRLLDARRTDLASAFQTFRAQQ